MVKEGVLFALDRGSSTAEGESGKSPFDLSVQCVLLGLQQRVFQNTNSECGLAIFGDQDCKDNGDGNNLLLCELQKPGLALVREVARLKGLRPSKLEGDLFQSLHFCVNQLGQNYGIDKTMKRVFLFAGGKGATQSDEEDIAMLAKNIQKADIKVNVVCFGFMDNYDMQENRLIEASKLTKEQEQNALLLVRLKDLAPLNIQILTAEVAIQLYRQFRKPEKPARPLFRDNLEIGPLSMGVAVYKYVRECKLKSLKKYSTKAEFSAEEKQGGVSADSVFYRQDDAGMQPVEAEFQAKGYQYGTNLVPISQVMEEGMKIYEDKGMKLLGFVQSSKVPRHSFMSGVDIVVPSEDIRSRKLFSSLLFSMLSTKKYGLVRYVARKNSRGVSPKLMALIPKKNEKGECFYLVELPTAEDVREYQFSSLRESTPQQQELVGKLIQKMSLVDEDGEELLKVKHTFNPYRQYFFQSVFHKVSFPDQELPPLDPLIEQHLHPQRRIRPLVVDLCAEIRKEFKLQVKLTEKKKNLVLLKDLMQRTQKQLSVADSDETCDPALVSVLKKKMFADEPLQRKIPEHNPLPVFRKMIAQRTQDLVETAMKQLQAIVTKAASTGIQEQVKQGVQWTAQLRKAAVEEDQAELYDQWLTQMKAHKDFMGKLVQAGIGFIKQQNKQLFAAPVLSKVLERLDVDQLD